MMDMVFGRRTNLSAVIFHAVAYIVKNLTFSQYNAKGDVTERHFLPPSLALATTECITAARIFENKNINVADL